MSPLLVVLPKGKSPYITLSPSGELIFPAHCVRQLQWKNGIKIRINYFESPLTLVLERCDDELGYTLHSVGHDDEGESSSKIRIAKLVNNVLRVRVKLPMDGLEPILLPASCSHKHELAIKLVPSWDWIETTFDVNGFETIASKLIGLYQILSGDGRILKIGEGQIPSRMKEAMKITDLVRQGRTFRYLIMEKSDAELLEQITLAEHRGKFGELPPFNPINQ